MAGCEADVDCNDQQTSAASQSCWSEQTRSTNYYKHKQFVTVHRPTIGSKKPILNSLWGVAEGLFGYNSPNLNGLR